MKRICAGIGILMFLHETAFGQAFRPAAAFPAAEVRVSARYHATNILDSLNPMTEGVLRGGRYEVRSATMLDLIRIAYGVESAAVLGGPNWLDWDRFDVIAAVPASIGLPGVRLMLRTLLADRFRLVAHNDTEMKPAYVLTTGKRLQVKRAEASENAGCVERAGVSLCRNMTMAKFAAWLHTSPRAINSIGSNPIVDHTGLDGGWDFNIQWSAPAQPGAGGTTLFDAIDKQLGLRLDLETIPTPVVAVESVDEKPAMNPPQATKSLELPLPAQFEVASVRPAPPGERPGIEVQPGGRVTFRAWPLNLLVWMAWDISDPDEDMVGAPKWLSPRSAPLFDIVAKAPVSSEGEQISDDDIKLMLRALLTDRFRMTTHYEDRPVTAYTLATAKPKLKKADAAKRTGCRQETVLVAREPGAPPPLPRVKVTCQNITMTQFAEELQSIAPAYIHHPALDATSLSGAWDFTLTFSRDNPANFMGRLLGIGNDVSLFEAMTRQLGLKLEMHKGSALVLVIDHMEETPTDN